MAVLDCDQFVFTKIIVADIERAYDFYNKVFGMVEIARISNGEGLMEMHEIIMGRAGAAGIPIPTLIVQRYPNRPVPSSELVTLGFNVMDIEATVSRAVAAGAAVKVPVTTDAEHGVKVSFLTDPQGHLLEVLQYL